MRTKYLLIVLLATTTSLSYGDGDETTEKPSTGRGMVDFLMDYLSIKYDGVEFSEFIYVGAKRQKLYYIQDSVIVAEYDISTAKNGVGFIKGSNQTPTGLHSITEMYGDSVPEGGIILNRHYTGEIAEIIEEPISVETDDVTTRVMWLDGEEDGINKGGDRDTHSRLIYIHGTPEEGLIGTPASHGCIRMRNSEVIELFEMVTPGLRVIILNN